MINRIVLETNTWGQWTASTTIGSNSLECKNIDREEALIGLLSKTGVEVVKKGEYWILGQRKEWTVSNMPG